VAVPVAVGSPGRVPLAALTDRSGGRVMFPLVSAGGFFLGVGGTALPPHVQAGLHLAFSVYLPTYLKTGRGLTRTDAANRMAGLVLRAVVVTGALVQSFTLQLGSVYGAYDSCAPGLALLVAVAAAALAFTGTGVCRVLTGG
jgi:nitrate/nitrite transporter NarK